MQDDIPLEKKFRILVEISRASHFAWREAVRRSCPGADMRQVVNEMWELTGVQTAESYLAHLDRSKSLPEQIAASIVWSSRCMGETAHCEPGPGPGEFHVRHEACPWHRWHEKHGLLAEDREGCDRWFQATIRTINERLGTNLTVETLATLPEGDPHCLRRIREE